jgi:hypothetical protein
MQVYPTPRPVAPKIIRQVLPYAVALALAACAIRGTSPETPVIPLPPLQAGELPVKVFAALPSFDDLQLSPSGRYLAYLFNSDDGSSLITQDRDGQNRKFVLRADNKKFHFHDFAWVNDDRLVVSVWYPAADWDGLKYERTHLLAINRDGTELKSDLLSDRLAAFGGLDIPQFQHRFELIPGNDREILIQLPLNRVNAPDLYKLDIHTGKKNTG